MTTCAIWMRVSTDSQENENQGLQLRAWAARRGLDVTREYRVEASAWHGAQHPALREAMNDARLGGRSPGRGAYKCLERKRLVPSTVAPRHREHGRQSNHGELRVLQGSNPGEAGPDATSPRDCR